MSLDEKETRWKDTSEITEEQFQMLEDFVSLVQFNYNILDFTPLKFFKEYLEKDLGANLPKVDTQNAESPKEETGHRKFYGRADKDGDAWTKESKEEEEKDDDSSEFEEDTEGVIAGDDDPPQEMGDATKEVSDEDAEQANNMKMLGIDALNGGDCEGAIKHFTTGIQLDGTKTVLFIKRATAFLRLTPPKPNAAARDAQRALSINPDSAASHKVLGKALRFLGKWELACHHLEEAQKIDFDDNVVEILKEIKPKANRIRDHRLSKERRKREKEIAEKLKRAEQIRKAQEQAKKEQEERDRENMASAFNFAEEMQDASEAASESDEVEEEEEAGAKITEVEDDLD